MADWSRRALAQAVLAMFVLVGGGGGPPPPPPTLLVLLCTALALLAAALMPQAGWPVLATGLLAGGAVTVLGSGSSANVGWFAVCVLAGWCALRGGPGPAASFAAVATAGFAVQAAVDPDPGWAAWIAGTWSTALGGLVTRRQQVLLEQLREAQAGLTERVRLQERNRVARELHDVIAHSLTVSLLHVTSARLAVEDDPAEAVEALARAEELGRRSLTEVRHAVGLLRDGPGAATPLPDAEQLPALVEGFRRAGADVAYDVVGDATRLSATTGLTVYRILQESLTNAARHGGGSRADVHLAVDGSRAVLTVDTAGPPGPPGSGLGLAGMRERAEALGGELVAGPAGPAGHGWRVHAVLPA